MYILKPESFRFPALPYNEHLSMQIARMISIEVPPCGLIRLKDGVAAYIIRRFDRTANGGKLPVEDFCQLSEKRIRDKYHGSAELCAKIVRKFASEPLIELQKLFRLILFSWWMANGDMHLKNFSLLTTSEGIRRLSPAYDLVCTKLVIPDDVLALPVGGRNKKFTRRHWLDFASYCEIPERVAKRMLAEQIETLDAAIGLIAASLLTDRAKDQYEQIVRTSTSALAG
jgi:serine/threonine-protein kinase HipA